MSSMQKTIALGSIFLLRTLLGGRGCQLNVTKIGGGGDVMTILDETIF